MPKEILLDFETSGLSPAHDQPLSVHVKVYDNDEMIDSLDLKCRSEKSRLPSPIAIYVNHLTPEDLTNNMPLRDMMKYLYEFIEKHQPGNIIAYNSKFDFNFSFNHYYQNLITPNWYQWKYPNRVICALEVLRSIYIFKKQMSYIQIPFDSFATPNFRLERVAYDNHINVKSHTASGDVDAMYKILCLMKEESPHIYSQAIKSSTKKMARSILLNEPFFCTTTGTGEDLQGRILVPIAYDPKGIDVICVDIGLVDTKYVSNISSWEIFLMTSKYARDNWIVKIPLNKSKVFFGPEQFEFCNNPSNASVGELLKRAKNISKKSHFTEACQEVFEFFDNLYKNNDRDSSIERAIFDGFCDSRERDFINEFNGTPWIDRWGLAKSQTNLCASNRIVRLAKKTILEYDSLLAPTSSQESFNRYCDRKLFNIHSKSEPPWTTINTAMYELSELNKQYPDDIKRLKEIEKYFDWRTYPSL